MEEKYQFMQLGTGLLTWLTIYCIIIAMSSPRIDCSQINQLQNSNLDPQLQNFFDHLSENCYPSRMFPSLITLLNTFDKAQSLLKFGQGTASFVEIEEIGSYLSRFTSIPVEKFTNAVFNFGSAATKSISNIVTTSKLTFAGLTASVGFAVAGIHHIYQYRQLSFFWKEIESHKDFILNAEIVIPIIQERMDQLQTSTEKLKIEVKNFWENYKEGHQASDFMKHLVKQISSDYALVKYEIDHLEVKVNNNYHKCREIIENSEYQQRTNKFVAAVAVIISIRNWYTGWPVLVYGCTAAFGIYNYYFAGIFEEVARKANSVCLTIAELDPVIHRWDIELRQIDACLKDAERVMTDFVSK